MNKKYISIITSLVIFFGVVASIFVIKYNSTQTPYSPENNLQKNEAMKSLQNYMSRKFGLKDNGLIPDFETKKIYFSDLNYDGLKDMFMFYDVLPSPIFGGTGYERKLVVFLNISEKFIFLNEISVGSKMTDIIDLEGNIQAFNNIIQAEEKFLLDSDENSNFPSGRRVVKYVVTNHKIKIER